MSATSVNASASSRSGGWLKRWMREHKRIFMACVTPADASASPRLSQCHGAPDHVPALRPTIRLTRPSSPYLTTGILEVLRTDDCVSPTEHAFRPISSLSSWVDLPASIETPIDSSGRATALKLGRTARASGCVDLVLLGMWSHQAAARDTVMGSPASSCFSAVDPVLPREDRDHHRASLGLHPSSRGLIAPDPFKRFVHGQEGSNEPVTLHEMDNAANTSLPRCPHHYDRQSYPTSSVSVNRHQSLVNLTPSPAFDFDSLWTNPRPAPSVPITTHCTITTSTLGSTPSPHLHKRKSMPEVKRSRRVTAQPEALCLDNPKDVPRSYHEGDTPRRSSSQYAPPVLRITGGFSTSSTRISSYGSTPSSAAPSISATSVESDSYRGRWSTAATSMVTLVNSYGPLPSSCAQNVRLYSNPALSRTTGDLIRDRSNNIASAARNPKFFSLPASPAVATVATPTRSYTGAQSYSSLHEAMTKYASTNSLSQHAVQRRSVLRRSRASFHNGTKPKRVLIKGTDLPSAVDVLKWAEQYGSVASLHARRRGILVEWTGDGAALRSATSDDQPVTFDTAGLGAVKIIPA